MSGDWGTGGLPAKIVWTGRVEGWYVLRAENAFAWLCPSIGLGAEAIYAGGATRWRFRD